MTDLPWRVSDAAIEDYCDTAHLDAESQRDFASARKALCARLLEPMRFKRLLNSGCQSWRLVEKPRIYLVVDPRTQVLTAVLPEHGRARR